MGADRPRLLLYTHYFSPSVGGVETSVALLAEGLVQGMGGTASYALTVATSTPAGAASEANFPYPVVRSPSWIALWRLIQQADLVHLAGPVFRPLFLSWLADKPVVIEHHGYQAVCPNGLLLEEPTKKICPGYFQQKRFDRCLRCVASVYGMPSAFRMIVGTLLRRALSKRVSANVGITAHAAQRNALPRSSFIYYGIKDPGPQPAAALPQAPLLFAYVGRLVPEKGLPLLLEAANELKKSGHVFRLAFIGEGPDRAELESKAIAYGLKDLTRFTGFLQGDALTKAVGEAAAVVMPSIWEETAGLAAIEHMMRGRVVIAAKVGGLGEVVGSAGLTFPMGDAVALQQAMKKILDDPACVQTLGHAARERAQTLFLQPRMVKDHVSLYEQVLTLA